MACSALELQHRDRQWVELEWITASKNSPDLIEQLYSFFFFCEDRAKLRVLSSLHGYSDTRSLNRQLEWNALPKIQRFDIARYCAA